MPPSALAIALALLPSAQSRFKSAIRWSLQEALEEFVQKTEPESVRMRIHLLLIRSMIVT